MDLKGKVALITGGTGGIGRAAAVAFARRGAAVVVTGRREAEGNETVKLVEREGARGLFVRADTAVEADVARSVQETVRAFGGLHYAFNNAGVEGLAGVPTTDQTIENYRHVFDINVLGVLLSMKHEIPAIVKSGGGAIVNNASIGGTIGMPGFPVYIASKHAVIGLTKSAALETAKMGVRINAVSPAAIDTDMYDRFTEKLGGQQAREYMASLHPIGRVGTAPEVAEAVVWLCSPGASFITGHNLNVDGGFTVP